MGAIISLALMLILFWILLVLPQRRRMQAQRMLLSSLEVGDEVMTNAGMYATLVAIDGDTVDLQIADGVVVRSARWAVAQRVTEPDPDELDDEEHDADPRSGDSTGDIVGAGDEAADAFDVDDR